MKTENTPSVGRLVHMELRRDCVAKKWFWHKSGRERSWVSQYFKNEVEAEAAKTDGSLEWKTQG
jgi:hypothetical protein